MAKFTLHIEQTIPFYEDDGTPMQLVNTRFGVTAMQEEGETIEEVKEKLNRELDAWQNYAVDQSNFISKKKQELSDREKKLDKVVKGLTTEFGKEKLKKYLV